MTWIHWAPLALLLLVGCSDAVDPTLGTDQAFSLYGYLDPTADRQAIRVVPITGAIEADTAAVLDLTVTSTEPETGRTAVWRDSVVTYRDGSIGHVFVADYTPTPDARVEIDVRATDGGRAGVGVQTPPLARPSVGEPTEAAAGTYPITIEGVPRVLGGTLRVIVTGLPGTTEPSALDIPVGQLEIGGAGGTWTLAVPFLEATRAHLLEIGLYRAGLSLVEAEFSPFVANEAWAVPPRGFDLDAIVEPGTFSNVTGGFGFVGAGYRAPVRWVPSTSVQNLAGFAVTNDPAAQLAVNEVGDGYVELFNPTPLAVPLEGYIVSMTGPGGGTRLGAGAAVPPRGFLVVEGPFAANADAVVQLLTGSGRLLKQAVVSYSAPAWGAYPDGYSFRLPQGVDDFFYGAVVASPGSPNRPAAVPAEINEIQVSGEGFVEVRTTTLEVEPIWVAASQAGVAVPSNQPTGRRPFLVAPEGPGLALDPLGGEAFLVISFQIGDLFDAQVIDARRYGPQVPDRSEGYLPDGAGRAWTPGLRPTPGAANAAVRLGL